MAYSVKPIDAYGKVSATVATSTAILRGQLVGIDSAGEAVLADADGLVPCYGIAGNDADVDASDVAAVGSSNKVTIHRAALIEDLDAPYTLGDLQYVSDTAGSMTATRPTGATSLIQQVGESLNTSQVLFKGGSIVEQTIHLQLLACDGTAAMSSGASSDFAGVGLLAAADSAYASFQVPQNAIAGGVVIAKMWHTNHASSPALDTSDTITVDVSAGADDETNTATTDGIAAGSLAVADNDLALTDITAAFDGTGIIEAGNVVGIDVNKAAEGAGGDDPLMMCIAITLKVVEPC